MRLVFDGRERTQVTLEVYPSMMRVASSIHTHRRRVIFTRTVVSEFYNARDDIGNDRRFVFSRSPRRAGNINPTSDES